MDAINVLWTGGWDSTYRVLELLLIENQVVKPHYIVDPRRKSIENEIIAMTRIRHRLQVSFPVQAARLQQVEMVHLEAIQPDDEITRNFKQLENKFHIGLQYEWLARFAKYHITEPELCAEKVTPGVSEIIGTFLPPLIRGKGHACRIEGPFPETGMQIFAYFRFPVIHLTKAEMRNISEEKGFSDIMKLTWFCHTPREGLPCGRCRPCLHAPASGLEYTFYHPTVWDKIRSTGDRCLTLLMK